MYFGQGEHVIAQSHACKCVSADHVQGSVRGAAGEPRVKLIAAGGLEPGADHVLRAATASRTQLTRSAWRIQSRVGCATWRISRKASQRR